MSVAVRFEVDDSIPAGMYAQFPMQCGPWSKPNEAGLCWRFYWPARVVARQDIIDRFLAQVECMAIAYRPDGVP